VRMLRSIARLRAGDTAAALAELPALTGTAMPGGLAYSSAGLLSGLYAQLGDVDGAVAWAGRVAEAPRHFYAVEFARHWYWERVRSEPRFQSFLASLRE
jgi:hypothetical protein